MTLDPDPRYEPEDEGWTLLRKRIGDDGSVTVTGLIPRLLILALAIGSATLFVGFVIICARWLYGVVVG